ncbi:ABC transporter ATP-binding protein [Amycolatopsis sp. NPDC058340]|uniref:ABC transporter ATP-binding protein n=1 Tax=Amycolatopsis sp. NPDC058340 TaxID=3346453 RepID=UPI003646FA45
MTDPLLQVDDLHVSIRRPRAEPRPILRGVSFGIRAGEAFGLVGESGSGKSMTARSVLRLLPDTARTGGTITFDGVDVGGLNAAGLRRLRSHSIAMIFQDPRAHINPVRTVGDFLCEGLVLTRGATRKDARRVARRLLTDVRIADAGRRLRQHPYELSGGLLQRVMIAAALAIEPKLILADEPTTALDVTTQEEVMAILDEQRRRRELALLFITHDLDLAAAVCDRTAVMYAGRIVETAPTGALHGDSAHPYTRALLSARPATARPGERLVTVPGRPAAAWEAGEGCAFRPRCPRATEQCGQDDPADRAVRESVVACHHAHADTEVTA